MSVRLNLCRWILGPVVVSTALALSGCGRSEALDRATPAKTGSKAPEGGRLGFVVRHWYSAVYETKFMDECEDGLTLANDEIWWRTLSKADRAKLTGNGLLETLRRVQPAMQRGPNGENVCMDPNTVKDPPTRTVTGATSYGINLDGTTDGSATAKTCAHKKFSGPNGEAGIDNQMYRLLGCTYGWRTNGIFEVNGDEMRGTSGLGMILIDITGVDDVRNDDDVTVTFYRSIDQFAQDSSGQPLPFSSYRIDTNPDGTARYGDSIKGAIKNGKLITTKTGDVRLPNYGNYNFTQHIFKDMSLELTISDDGRTADGMVYGYYDIDEFLYHTFGMPVVFLQAFGSCPAMRDSAYELADGYPDPKTGKCTALSSAFRINTYAAYVTKPAGLKGKELQAQR